VQFMLLLALTYIANLIAGGNAGSLEHR
jgi:hypothetical protein